MPATGWLTSPTGLVLGGVTACLADFALGAAMHTTVPPGTAVAPTGLRVQFIRPAPGDGRQVTARATVVHRGRGLAAARAEVTDSEARLLALADASALILPGRRADLSDAPPRADTAPEPKTSSRPRTLRTPAQAPDAARRDARTVRAHPASRERAQLVTRWLPYAQVNGLACDVNCPICEAVSRGVSSLTA